MCQAVEGRRPTLANSHNPIVANGSAHDSQAAMWRSELLHNYRVLALKSSNDSYGGANIEFSSLPQYKGSEIGGHITAPL